MIEVIFFTFFSMMAVAAALSVILQRNPVYSALSLIIVIASMGGLFLLLNAAFLAVLQIIIYAGAIMALFLFVIMMVEIPDDAIPTTFHLYGKLALLLLILIAGATIWSIRTMNDPFPALTADFSVRNLSMLIFTTHLFPFEAIGILIVSAVVGALYIAKKEAA